MGKDTFFGYAAAMLLLSIGGVSATPRGFEPHTLQQETVGAGRWHKYESLFWMYANTDLDSLNPTQRDAGYFGIKRPNNVHRDAASDESIFKLRIHSDGIPALNDGNITLCHPTIHRIRAPSFLPLRTAAELEYHTLYNNVLTQIEDSEVLDAKLSLEQTLRHINHCGSPQDSDTPWGLMEAHPLSGRLAPVITSAVTRTRFRDVDGKSVDARVLHVLVSQNNGHSAGSEVDAAFDVLYTMNPEPRIRFVSVPAERSDHSQVGYPNWARIIEEAGNPLMKLLKNEKDESEDKGEDDLELTEAEEREAEEKKHALAPTTASHRDEIQRKQRVEAIQAALHRASKGSILIHTQNTPTNTTSTPMETPEKSHLTITFVKAPVTPSSITMVLIRISKTPLELLSRIRPGTNNAPVKPVEVGNDQVPGTPGPGAIALVLWSLFWVAWAFCVGLYTCRIARYILWRMRGSPPKYQRVRTDEDDCERGVIVLSPDYFTVGLDTPEGGQSFAKPMLSSISEKTEPEDDEEK
ncbi:uncharacterized protein H6S33_010314 [Morchella sextelata]|uniref:uncharacterized protein n=1 Tax=Morchella sextelata TaxID=1174677 RepID=UPI001D03DE0F|nr:uncharacterized protein H6S33_010314 [Morchella sextelata]KAH0612262.1 hypothetical protein H6S33_010314 [Morchella sextelata]